MLAIVTGANSGMGRATVAALADKGYEVIMLCRDAKRGEEAFYALKEERKDRNIELMLCDLGNYGSIREFAKVITEKGQPIDVRVQKHLNYQTILNYQSDYSN